LRQTREKINTYAINLTILIGVCGKLRARLRR
jgi:hypothetical protein